MKNKKIILLVGIPAAGKNTWLEKFLRNNPNYVNVERDAYRYMLRNSGWLDPKGEQLVTKLVETAIVDAINNKYNVIVNQTNVNLKYLRPFVEWCRELADVEFQIFDVSKEVAIERDANRERSVGKDVIEKMYKNYLELFDSNFDFSPRKKKDRIVKDIKFSEVKGKDKAVIFDIDGTLAHNNGKRGYFDWNKVYLDVVDEILKETVLAYKNAGFKILMVTGRDGECEDLTKEWLDVNGIPFDDFYCRPANNFEKDTVIKRRIYRDYIKSKYNVLGVYDDRTQVVEMWREEGLKCFQVMKGDY